jgi:hypothetical protein
VSWDAGNEAYVLETDVAQYRVVIGEGEEQSGQLRIEGRVGEEPWQPLARGAGMLLREGEGAVLPPAATHQRCELQELRHQARGRILLLKYVETLDGRALRRTVEVRLSGRSLEIRLEAPGGRAGEGYCGFSLGRLGPDGARAVSIPGLPDPLYVTPPGGFLCAYPDRYVGAASSYPPGGAFYRQDLDGDSRAISETFYLTLSPEPLDPLPGLGRAPAPDRGALAHRITVDFFSEGAYRDDARLLALLRQYGLKDVLLIYRNWQQFGYRRRGPLLYPADRSRGSNDEFRQMLADAAEGGWLVALREEYATAGPDSPYWDEKALARWWDGLPRQARRPGQYGIIADRMIEFARLESTKIQRNYRPGAVFVDGHTAWNPEGGLRQVDSAPKAASGTEAQAIGQVESLLHFLREVHEGPVVGAAGEGAVRFDTFAEGMADAVLRGPDRGRSAPLIVDYELREVRPKLLGVGAGSYRQFCGSPTDEPVDAGRVDWDAYRATEIAMGHAGYVGNYRVRPGPRGVPFPGGSAAVAVREYYMLHALQAVYLDAALKGVRYRDGEEMVELGEALRRGLDLPQAQLCIEYATGLTVWVNRSGRDSWTVGPDEASHELPPNGFLALAPRQKLLAYSALRSGHHVDFCRSPSYTFLDARGSQLLQVEELSVDGSVAVLKSAVAGRHDVVLVGVRQFTLGGEEEYRLSERGDMRLTHLSTREVEVALMDTENGKPAHISWPAFTSAWRGPSMEVREMEAMEWEERGEEWRESRCQVQQTGSGPQLGRARPGVTYRVRVPGP